MKNYLDECGCDRCYEQRIKMQVDGFMPRVAFDMGRDGAGAAVVFIGDEQGNIEVVDAFTISRSPAARALLDGDPIPAAATSSESEKRKATPIFSGVMRYFPDALAAVARVSKAGNDKHNPGQPLHWSRAKSADHGDCIARHQITFDQIDRETGEFHAAAVAWRALAQLQLLEETREKVAA